jgi:hypothetical protein
MVARHWKNIYSRLQPVFMGVQSNFSAGVQGGRLQGAARFVTTVRRDTALEALARRGSRLDVSEILVSCGPISLQR